LKINCRHAHELLSAQMDKPLPLGQRLRLRLHLSYCNLCSRVERQMKFIRTAMKRLGP
jgi:hypothetical protein